MLKEMGQEITRSFQDILAESEARLTNEYMARLATQNKASLTAAKSVCDNLKTNAKVYNY